ncbi:AraC-like DNA-binding protein [Anaerotaenia torta]|uniref:AraC family transcriptional regulator n=1 Tax=Anaerotaenia torta TaxID=433293 RepID=UPI003D1A8024
MDTKNNRFLRRFVISYSALLLVILIMGGYLYSISIKNVRTEIRTQTKFTLEKTISDLDSKFETMDVLAGQVAANSHVIRLANWQSSNESDYYIEAYRAKNDLSVYVFTESLLPSSTYFIYLQKPDYILSFSQFQQSRFYYTGEWYHKDKYEEWLDMMNASASYKHLVPLAPYYTPYPAYSYLYILPLNSYTLKNVPATICFVIDHQKLADAFSELNFYESGHLYVTDENGSPAFTLLGEKSEEADAGRLTSLPYENGFSEYTAGHRENMFVTHARSRYNGWNYYLIQPVDASLYSLIQYRDLFLLIIFAALLVEFIMIFFLSKSNVKPILQLGKELQDILTTQKSLQKMAEEQIPVIRYSYLAKIMQGGISTQEELEYARHYLNISTEQRKFTVLYIVAYVNQFELYVADSAVTGPDTTNYKEIIQKAVAHTFGEAAYIHSSDDREYAILLSSPLEEPDASSSSNVKEKFRTLHEYLMSTHSIWTFAGLGDWNSGLMVTWKSYQQARQAVTYTTKKHMIRTYSKIEREQGGFYYPIELTRQLTNFITVGNKSQVLEIFELLRQENMEKRSLPINIIKYLISDIHNTLYRIRFSLKNTEKNEAGLNSVDALFDQHMSLKLCEDIALLLCELSETNSGGNELITNIKAYINKNYMDPSLGLTKISDEFSISESYFSYLFKEETGENFSSYLERIRMEHSLHLLKETDINVSLLYQEVGYNNSNSFRRAFKKIYGMSPKDFRNSVNES